MSCKNPIFLNFGDIFTFPNACAIQTNLVTKELLEKTVLENMGYWQNGLEIEKKCDFKVPLGRLELKSSKISFFDLYISERFGIIS